MNENNQKMTDLKDSVLKRIEAEGIEPHSRLYWLSHEYALWGSWGLTILLGAVSLAVISFASLHMGYAIYEATHDDFLTFMVDNLPYLWLVAFLILSAAAYFNLRHTKRGYRYPVVMVVGSSIGFSIIGGVALHFLGIGYYFDQFLGQNIPQYHSREEFALELWQRPQLGRLVGQASKIEEAAALEVEVVPFTDLEHKEWNLRTDVLSEDSMKLLRSGNKVRVLTATTSSEGTEISYACFVMPWIFDHPPLINELRENRQDFIQDVRVRREKLLEKAEKTGRQAEKRVKSVNPAVGVAVEAVKILPGVAERATSSPILQAPPTLDDASPCAGLPIFKDIKVKVE